MTNTRDRLDALTDIWHVDGPHSTESVVAAADGIKELVRYLNHATHDPSRYVYMSQVGEVVSNLAGAVYGLDQMLDQMGNAIFGHVAAGELYDDSAPNDPAAGIGKGERALVQLTEARRATAQLASRLQELSSTTNGIGHRDT